MAETDPGSETPAVLGDTWSGLPHYTCSLCGWDSMDAARLTEHLQFEHPAPVVPLMEEPIDMLILDPDEENGKHARDAEAQEATDLSSPGILDTPAEPTP